MKKGYLLLIMMLVFSAFTGCAVQDGPQADQNEETAFDSLWNDAPEGTIAILINRPTEEQLADYPVSESLVLDETEERLLLIPAEDVDTITIWNLEYIGDELERTGSVYINRDIPEDFVLDMTVIRPEGAPYFQLSLEGVQRNADYYISYNGKDGNPNIEYIEAE